MQYWILFNCPYISRKYDAKPQFNKNNSIKGQSRDE